jgi:hypothetical protein
MISFVTTFLINLLITPVKATESIPLSDPKIEEFIEETLKPTVAKINTIDEPIISNQPKSFFGSITQINENLISINFENQNKVLQLSNETVFINSKHLKTKATEFKVGQTVLAMGYLNQSGSGSLDCHRIVATDTKSIENNNQIITGQIVDVPQSQDSIFAFTPFQNKDVQYQIKIDSKTEINNTDKKKLKSSETIIKGKKVIIVMHSDNENGQTFYATKIISLDTDSLSLSPTPTTQP